MRDDPCGPGFPIRKSTDQSLFAAPHGLSQRTTSFIASRRQGIHRMPLRRLITLIIDARHPTGTTAHVMRKDQRSRSASRKARSRFPPSGTTLLTEAGSAQHLHFTMSNNTRDLPSPEDGSREFCRLDASPHRGTSRRPMSPADPAVGPWWSQTGSNRRPPACKAGALPAELWPQRAAVGSGQSAVGPDGRRDPPTADCRLPPLLVGLGRFELPTSPLSGVRSNRLSYRPEADSRRTAAARSRRQATREPHGPPAVDASRKKERRRRRSPP